MADRDSAATPIRITVRYYAAARGAAGATEERLHLPPAATVADVIALAVHEHGPKLGAVIARCSFLLNETAVRDGSTPVGPGSVIDVLPPFAGGDASANPRSIGSGLPWSVVSPLGPGRL